MAKADVFSGFLKRPEKPTRTQTFVSESQPGLEVTLTLRGKSVVDSHRQDDIEEDLVRRYITGPGTYGREPDPFPPVGGEVVVLSRSLLNYAAGVVVQQCPEDESSVYSAEELIAIAHVAPDIWGQILSLAGFLSLSVIDPKKDSPEGTEPSADLPSWRAPDTPNSSSEPTPSSDQSMTG